MYNDSIHRCRCYFKLPDLLLYKGNKIGPDWAVSVGSTGDVETLADRITLPMQHNVSRSLKDWLPNIKEVINQPLSLANWRLESVIVISSSHFLVMALQHKNKKERANALWERAHNSVGNFWKLREEYKKTNWEDIIWMPFFPIESISPAFAASASWLSSQLTPHCTTDVVKTSRIKDQFSKSVSFSDRLNGR